MQRIADSPEPRSKGVSGYRFLFPALLYVLLAACGSDRDGAARARAIAPVDPALNALADTLLPKLERLSRLQARSAPVLERRTLAQVRAFVERQLEQEMPPAELEGMRSAYALFGLIPDSLDLRALLLELYAEQIVGYYDPEEKKLFVVEGVPANVIRPVLAHELVHALQDQYTNLDSLIARERGNDRQTAAQAAIEGHATLVTFALLAEESARRPVDPVTVPNPANQLRAALEQPNSEFPVFRRAPRIIRETLLFPYVAGAHFVQELWRTQSESARTAPIDTLLPQSTEQVSHPLDHFIRERDEPTELRISDVEGWNLVYENTLGQLELGVFLEEHVGGAAHSAAKGWDGDRYRLLESNGARVLVWYIIWDDDASADHFLETLRPWLVREGAEATAQRGELEGRPLVGITIARGLTSPPPVTSVGIRP